MVGRMVENEIEFEEIMRKKEKKINRIEDEVENDWSMIEMKGGNSRK